MRRILLGIVVVVSAACGRGARVEPAPRPAVVTVGSSAPAAALTIVPGATPGPPRWRDCAGGALRAAFQPEAKSRWTPDERFVATPGGYLVEPRAGRTEALPVGRPLSADDGQSVAVVDAKGVVWVRATTPGAATRRVAEDAFGVEIEPQRARVMIVRGHCATQLVRLDGTQPALELGALATSRVLWTDRVAAWTSEGVLHAVEIATHVHHEAPVQPKEDFVPTAPSEDGPDPIAPEAFAVAPDLVVVLGHAGRLEVRGDTLGPPRWTRANVEGFAVSADGADVAIVEPPRDPARPDLRVRVLGAKDGVTKASRDLGPGELVSQQKRGRFTGVCGGGSLHAIAVKGTVVTFRRECSLVDLYEYDVAKDRIVREQHLTPEDDAKDASRLGALCARTRTKDCPSDPMPAWIVPNRVAVIASEKATHLFDVAKSRRLGTLDAVVDVWSLRGSPKGTYVVHDEGEAEVTDTRVWEVATARRLWSAPKRAP